MHNRTSTCMNTIMQCRSNIKLIWIMSSQMAPGSSESICPIVSTNIYTRRPEKGDFLFVKSVNNKKIVI